MHTGPSRLPGPHSLPPCPGQVCAWLPSSGPCSESSAPWTIFFVVVVVYSSRKGNNDNSTYLKTENFGKQKKAREQNTHLYWKSLIPTGGQREPLLGQSASLRLQERFHSRTRMHGSTTLMQMLGPVKLYTKKWSTESKKKNAVYYCRLFFLLI